MKVLRFLDENAEKILCCVLLGGATIIIFLQILLRVFGYPLAWTEEIARYMFIWLTYIGCSAAIRARRHISLDLIDLLLKERGRFIISIFSNLVFLAFALILAYYGFLITRRVTTQISPAVQLSMAIPYSSIMISACLMVVRLIQDTIKRFQERKEGGNG